MIYGNKMRLRGPERSDIPTFVKWFNDPDVREGISMIYPMSQAGEEKWFEDMISRPQVEHPMVIEIQLGVEWVAIGNCGFHEIDWRCRSADVGIIIGEKSYWDQGYGTKVMALLLEHGFKTLNLNRIGLWVFETNPRAIRTYEKVGFVREGVKRQAFYKNGRYIDMILMSVLRSEWSEVRHESPTS